jgi:hypothetical protein
MSSMISCDFPFVQILNPAWVSKHPSLNSALATVKKDAHDSEVDLALGLLLIVLSPLTGMAMQNINPLKPCHDIIDLISFLQNRRSHHTGGLLKVAADALCEYGNGQVTSICIRTPKGFHTDF